MDGEDIMTHVIRVRKSQLAYFGRYAHAAAPLEVSAYLVGVAVSPELTVVNYFAYTRKYHRQGPEDIEWTDAEFKRVKRLGEKRGLAVLGDIHSHPDYWPVLSPTDHSNHITAQHRDSAVFAWIGRKSVACFWTADSALPLQIEYL